MKNLILLTFLFSFSMITLKNAFSSDEDAANQINVDGKIEAILEEIRELTDEELEIAIGLGKIEAVLKNQNHK